MSVGSTLVRGAEIRFREAAEKLRPAITTQPPVSPGSNFSSPEILTDRLRLRAYRGLLESRLYH